MENQKNFLDISNVSEEVIHENELPSFLNALENQALIYIQNNELTRALAALKRSEEVMESISTQGGMLSSEHIISTLHNIAYCYQE